MVELIINDTTLTEKDIVNSLTNNTEKINIDDLQMFY